MDPHPSGPGEHPRPARPFTVGPARRVLDRLMVPLVRRGLVPHTYLLTTTGRTSGLPRTVPVTLVERDGRRWLVAPYGPVSWVHNARAAGRVHLRRGHVAQECAVREVGPQEAGPVLKAYLAITGPPRRWFEADKDAPVEDFVAEAPAHPVFELVPLRD